jgi:hypothetical protein
MKIELKILMIHSPLKTMSERKHAENRATYAANYSWKSKSDDRNIAQYGLITIKGTKPKKVREEYAWLFNYFKNAKVQIILKKAHGHFGRD